jgi:hypothetical protein
MPTETVTTSTYTIALSNQEWTPNGWYPEGHSSR